MLQRSLGKPGPLCHPRYGSLSIAALKEQLDSRIANGLASALALGLLLTHFFSCFNSAQDALRITIHTDDHLNPKKSRPEGLFFLIP